ncbi:MAG: alpha/beta fold hydrolase, partial [Saprospiraceae bacterium]
LSTMPNWGIKKYALLTTPDKFSERIDAVVEKVGLTEKVKQGLIDRIKAEIKQDVAGLNVSTFVQQIKVEEALIIHDVNDRVIPIEQSRRVQQNWSNCKLQEIEGTGHFKILRTPSVLQAVEEFLRIT